MDLAARMFSEQVAPPVARDAVYKPAKAAVDLGCDDPLLVYLYNRCAVGPNYPGDEEAIRRVKASAKALEASGYPVVRRAIALEMAGTYGLYPKAPTEAARKEAERDFDACLALLPKSVTDDEHNEFWESCWFGTLESLIAGYRKLGLEPPAALDRVDAALAKVPELKVLRLQLRGVFWLHYGWEARTQAFAPAVPAGGFETLEKRLDEAKKALEEAWQLRPSDAPTASSLLEIDKSIGGNRATMELWFDRAMKADGNCQTACWSKLDWLDPKWHGTSQEMIAFGRACRDTKNWRAGITLLVGDAHHRYMAMLPPAERQKYFRSPEVWSEVQSVYDEFLKHDPDNDVARSKYAMFAFYAGKLPESHAQFEILGDRLTSWTTFPYLPLEGLKRLRSMAANRVAGMRAAGAVPGSNSNGPAKP